MQEDLLLQTNKLCKAYNGKSVVNGIDITVHKGEVVGLLGPNGAGKTSSFYMIIGLLRPDTGTVIFQGKMVNQLPMYKRIRLGMGYLSQEPSVFRHMTVSDNILAVLETMNLSRFERKKRLDELIKLLDLEEHAKQKAIVLSGGQRRRLEITRALATNPSFMMLDEPFSGVDPIAVADVQHMIQRLKDMGLGVLITDHSLRETFAIVDRAYIIYEGEILCQGDRESLINDPEARKFYLGDQFVV